MFILLIILIVDSIIMLKSKLHQTHVRKSSKPTRQYSMAVMEASSDEPR